jgi:hypothetical protein
MPPCGAPGWTDPVPTDLRPRLDPAELGVGRWPVGWRPPTLPSGFFGLVEDEDEVTLVCAESALGGLDGALEVELGWRRITFAGPLPWEQVGFLADVATRLADAKIPFTSLAGFTTDHVLVRAAQADLAVLVLSGHEPPTPRRADA